MRENQGFCYKITSNQRAAGENFWGILGVQNPENPLSARRRREIFGGILGFKPPKTPLSAPQARNFFEVFWGIWNLNPRKPPLVKSQICSEGGGGFRLFYEVIRVTSHTILCDQKKNIPNRVKSTVVPLKRFSKQGSSCNFSETTCQSNDQITINWEFSPGWWDSDPSIRVSGFEFGGYRPPGWCVVGDIDQECS